MKETCKIHGDTRYLLVHGAGAQLCVSCVKAGFYKPAIEEDFYNTYPEEAPATRNEIVQAGELYRHWKGNLYNVIAIAKDSETQETMVVYASPTTGEQWVRSQKAFTEIPAEAEFPRFAFVR